MIKAALVAFGITFSLGQVYVQALPGDDNQDGIVMEDETGWDCRFMGNRVCGEPWEE